MGGIGICGREFCCSSFLRDFVPVSMINVTPMVIVTHPSLPVNSVKDLVDFARKNPGKVSYSSAGSGSAQHLSAAAFQAATGAQFLHVPFKGSPELLQQVIAGTVNVSANTPAVVLPHVKAGKIKVLAVNGDVPMPEFPGIGTYRAQGFALDVKNWWGVVGSAKAPREHITRLNRDIVKVTGDADYRKKFMEAFFYEPIGNTPEQFAENLKAGKVVAEAIANALKASGYRGE